jgi:hypothetical protein
MTRTPDEIFTSVRGQLGRFDCPCHEFCHPRRIHGRRVCRVSSFQRADQLDHCYSHYTGTLIFGLANGSFDVTCNPLIVKLLPGKKDHQA